MAFQISGLPKESFADLFDLDDEQLARRLARRMVVDAKPGYPCRVSLDDVDIGKEVILLNYQHLAVDSPFRSTHAIYVGKDSRQAELAVNMLPPFAINRLIAVRGFDATGMMIEADSARVDQLADRIEGLFEDTNISYLHLHFANQGCFAARVDRA